MADAAWRIGTPAWAMECPRHCYMTRDPRQVPAFVSRPPIQRARAERDRLAADLESWRSWAREAVKVDGEPLPEDVTDDARFIFDLIAASPLAGGDLYDLGFTPA